MRLWIRSAILPAVGLLIVSGGCKIQEPSGPNFAKGGGKGKLIFKDKVCVSFDEVRTSSDFATVTVVDEFATTLLADIADAGIADRINGIRMTGASMKLVGRYRDHEWTFTSSVDIERGDIVDGPKPLVNPSVVVVPPDLKGKGYTPDLNNMGVEIVDRALVDLLAGGNPELRVTMVGTSVVPEPSPSDPLVFTWEACIEITATLDPK